MRRFTSGGFVAACKIWPGLICSVTFILVGSNAIRAQQQPATAPWSVETERQLLKQYELFAARLSSVEGCLDCHSSDSATNLKLSGRPLEDLRRLIDEGYLATDGPDTLLERLSTPHPEKRMPKDGPRWSDESIAQVAELVELLGRIERETGTPADEQFPRSLLSEYPEPTDQAAPNQFLSYRQLKAKILRLFDDDGVRGDRDLFADNLAALGGADFDTRFNESTEPSAASLSALETLSKHVAERAFRHRTGPFTDWPWATTESKDTDSDTLEVAVQHLYQQVLLRPATDTEVATAVELVNSIRDIEPQIAQRDTELWFELLVTDSDTELSATRVIRLPVRGDRLEVQQALVDQRGSNSDGQQILRMMFRPLADQLAAKLFGPAKESGWHRAPIGEIRLGPDTTGRLELHNLDTYRNVTFAGVELTGLDDGQVSVMAADDDAVQWQGSWVVQSSAGETFIEDASRHKGLSSITVDLAAQREAHFQVAVLYKADAKNSNRVLVELFGDNDRSRLASHPASIPGEPDSARFFFDCGDDTVPYFELPAVFQFDEQDYVEVSNRDTLQRVTAGAAELVNAEQPDNNFLIDSEIAEGADSWSEFGGGSFGAYNVRGKKLEDKNRDKGQLSLKYRLRDRRDHGWRPEQFYQVRLYYPAKRDHEPRVPVHVRAQRSSPIVQVTYPSLAKADAQVRLDASASYTVQRSELHYQWRQIAGPTVSVEDWNQPTLEFKAPRLSANESAWVALVAGLIRHPDFLFTRPPSLRRLASVDTTPAEINTAQQGTAIEDQRPLQHQSQLQLSRLALDLLGRPPTARELEQLHAGKPLTEFLDDYLDSDDFRDFYFHRVRLYLESQGTPASDEPARLWSFVAFQDRPFQEILTADYTVDEAFKRVDRPAHHGRTGILTTPGFIAGKPGLPHYNYAAQVTMLFLGYVYEVPPEIVEQREGVTALGTTDPNSNCYSCHKILTPLTFQRLNWTDDGEYRTVDDQQMPIDASDRGMVAEYPFPGNGLEAFATQAVKKERFIRTMINTHVNFYFGRPMRHLTDERELYHRLWQTVHEHEFQIRPLIRTIVMSPEYWGTNAIPSDFRPTEAQNRAQPSPASVSSSK